MLRLCASMLEQLTDEDEAPPARRKRRPKRAGNAPVSEVTAKRADAALKRAGVRR